MALQLANLLPIVAVIASGYLVYVSVDSLPGGGAGELALRRPMGQPLPHQKFEPSEGAEFFFERNLIEMTVPERMTIDELIALYQLELSRVEILNQIHGRQILNKGDKLRFHLTPGVNQ